MSILPPLSSPPLTPESLRELLASDAVTDANAHLLRWLIWFPLLSSAELTRLEQARVAHRKQTLRPQNVAARLRTLEQFGLIAHLIVNEPGWPPQQYRYYLTDTGLSVFAAHAHPPLSVSRLARAYPVERADLIERLSHIDMHLVLADFSSRLVTEGSVHGLPVTSFQQPWLQTDILFGRRQRLRCDAAFLLATPQGTEHAFYVRIDSNERAPFEDAQERVLLQRLLRLRQALSLQRESMPQLLILTRASRLAAWGALLDTVSAQRSTALLDGAITTVEHMQRHGVYGRTWWPLIELVHGLDRGQLTALPAPSTSLSSLLGAPASPMLTERFSQRQSFAHLLRERPGNASHKRTRQRPSAVGKPLTTAFSPLQRAMVLDALRGTRAEQQEATALLNLALSARHKDLLFWLAHHPLLTIAQLAAIGHPGGRERRGVQQQMNRLAALHLLVSFIWDDKQRPWYERERYLLSEPALRYVALREGGSPTTYLLSEEEKKKKQDQPPALSIQSGTAGLGAQMKHTHGLYESMIRLLAGAEHDHVRVLAWNNAQEAVRAYPDPLTGATMQIRPDAELVYLLREQSIPQRVFIEYDRATEGTLICEAKYQGYADYVDATRLGIPPILVITQHERAATRIRTCIDAVAPRLSVLIILEEQVQRPGLLGLLTLLGSS